jgi:hypothetical protein
MHRTKHRLLFAVASLLLTGGFACEHVDDGNLREDVIHCEMALGHVLECCPGFSAPPKACVYHLAEHESSCGCGGEKTTWTEETVPVLDVSQSDGLAASSCEQIAVNDGCSSLAREFARDTWRSFGGECPASNY